MNLMESFISNSLSVSSGQSGPSSAVLYTQQALTPAQQTQARQNIQGEAAAKVVQISGPDAVITPEDNTIYQCGELTSLTITDPPASGAWSIVFTSGTTASTTTVPASILGLESFAAEANTIYEINVLGKRAALGSWAVQANE